VTKRLTCPQWHVTSGGTTRRGLWQRGFVRGLICHPVRLSRACAVYSCDPRSISESVAMVTHQHRAAWVSSSDVTFSNTSSLADCTAGDAVVNHLMYRQDALPSGAKKGGRERERGRQETAGPALVDSVSTDWIFPLVVRGVRHSPGHISHGQFLLDIIPSLFRGVGHFLSSTITVYWSAI